MLTSASSGIQLVVFDLGRVLIRICDGLDHACRRAGVEVQLENLDPSALRHIAMLSHQHEIGQIDIDGFAREAGRALNITPDDFLAISRAYLHHAFPGAAEMLSDLAANNIRTACLSNTNAHHWRMMNDPTEEAHIPLDRLNHRFASHLIRARKPDPVIYEHVERATSIPTGAILFFDDVVENLEAAQQRGWQTFHVNPRLENPIPTIRAELQRRRLLP